MAKRFWEIDALRGLAIIKMVIFNWSFTLMFLGVFVFNEGLMFQGWAAAVFIFLAGLCLTISYNRIKENDRKFIFKKYLKRSLVIFGYGMLLTIGSFLLFPKYTILFGILHFMALSVFLGQFLVKYRKLNIFLGIIFILLGVYLRNVTFDFPWLFWLGMLPRTFLSFDYFPVFPWFGITLFGIATGNMLYENGKRKFNLADLSENIITKFLTFLGKNSLVIYLIHQPFLILILLILDFI